MDRPISYTGRKPYIFISYSHADLDQVMPIIARLQRDGFRIWYDGDIESGGEWSDIICEHVDNCRGFIGFISKDSLMSEHCKDELSRIKKNRNATRVLIYLDNSELTGGMALNNERYQSVRWNRRAPEESLAKLYTARGLMVCNQNGFVPTLQLEPEPYVPRRHTAPRPRTSRKKLLIPILLGVVLVAALAVAVPRLVKNTNSGAGAMNKLLNAGMHQADGDAEQSGSVAPDSVTISLLDDDAVPMGYDDEESDGRESDGKEASIAPDSITIPLLDLDQGDAPLGFAGGTPLVSITEPAEQRNFSVRQDVTNTLGVTYKDAAVLFGSYSEPYVRYYVGDYSLLQGNFSIPQDVDSGHQFTLTVYLDDNETAPLPGYDRLELSRSTPKQRFSFDVSGANFITFALKPKDGSHMSGIMLTDCKLYTDMDEHTAPPREPDSGQNPAQDGTPLVSITEPAEQRNFSVRQDVTNTLGVAYKDAAVLFGSYSEPYVRYYVGDYSVLQGNFSIPQDVDSGHQFTLTVYLDDNETAPLPGYDRLELSRSTPEQSFSFDVSSANFITFALKPKDGSHMSGIMLTDCCLYQDASSAPAQAVSTGQNPAQDGKPLVSIAEPAEQRNFSVRQDVTNTLGVTYKDAAVLFGSYSEPYVRYYVGDYSVLQGKFSVPQDVGDGNEFTLTVYLDDNETAPLPGYDRLELSRSAPEQSFSFDVSGANFITFALKPKDGSHMSGIMLTDCCLYQ